MDIILCSLIQCATDTSILTLSRFILLDSILMFFIVASVLCVLKLDNCQQFACDCDSDSFVIDCPIRMLSKEWFGWLLAAGVFLGCAISCKMVGLFVLASVGLWTVSVCYQCKDAHRLITDLSCLDRPGGSPREHGKHVISQCSRFTQCHRPSLSPPLSAKQLAFSSSQL
jgi:hypothetical protein